MAEHLLVPEPSQPIRIGSVNQQTFRFPDGSEFTVASRMSRPDEVFQGFFDERGQRVDFPVPDTLDPFTRRVEATTLLLEALEDLSPHVVLAEWLVSREAQA